MLTGGLSDGDSALSLTKHWFIVQCWLLSTIKQVIKISNNLPFWMMSAFNCLAKIFSMPSSEILLLIADQKTVAVSCSEYVPLYFSAITSTGLSSSTLLFYAF